MRYAAIDIGSNAVKCMVGTVIENDYPVVIKEMYARVPIRLGTDVFQSGSVSADSEKKLLDSLQAFTLLMKSWHVSGAVIAATSAMRDAANGQDILRHIEEQTNLKTWIIKGKVEAALITELFAGLGKKELQKIMIDLGGGSTEVTFANPDGKRKSKSFQIGAVRSLLHEASKVELRKMLDFIEDNIDPFGQLIIASGGNINALKSHFGLAEPMYLSFQELQRAYDQLHPLSVSERVERFLIHPDRADVIVPAAEVFLKIMKFANAQKLMVPKAGLADALILMQHQGRTPDEY
jgi:exopolyphosphatase/guanosine-5'-triphosphate,3'-diphosphate pyrophosphatase